MIPKSGTSSRGKEYTSGHFNGEALGFSLLLITAFALVFVIGILLLYMTIFWAPISRDQELWAQFGDFFGGTVNPVLTFLTLVALMITISIQSKELSHTTDEMRDARIAQQQQLQELQAQREAQNTREKRSLTIDMLDRWTSAQMRAHRTTAWDYLYARLLSYESSHRATVNLDVFRREEKKTFEHFAEVCHFFSDVNKLLDEDLIDHQLFQTLFRDSVYPWFRLFEDINVGDVPSAGQPAQREYEERVKRWYETKVFSLKKHFKVDPLDLSQTRT
ncbi:hypothetical protein H0Z60_08575 [Ectothiorhodospiraceae bacterium WFHF3C12]|nr:hypothetical protein [Ectothiorhodospiraceae bacterium WFHF3C12]